MSGNCFSSRINNLCLIPILVWLSYSKHSIQGFRSVPSYASRTSNNVSVKQQSLSSLTTKYTPTRTKLKQYQQHHRASTQINSFSSSQDDSSANSRKKRSAKKEAANNDKGVISIAKGTPEPETTSTTPFLNKELELLEKEILSSTQSKLDWKYVQDAVFGASSSSSTIGSLSYSNPNGDTRAGASSDTIALGAQGDSGPSEDSLLSFANINKKSTLVLSQLEISVASSLIFGLISYALIQQLIVSGVAFSIVFLLANGNPLDEENAVGTFVVFLALRAISSFVWLGKYVGCSLVIIFAMRIIMLYSMQVHSFVL